MWHACSVAVFSVHVCAHVIYWYSCAKQSMTIETTHFLHEDGHFARAHSEQ